MAMALDRTLPTSPLGSEAPAPQRAHPQGNLLFTRNDFSADFRGCRRVWGEGDCLETAIVGEEVSGARAPANVGPNEGSGDSALGLFPFHEDDGARNTALMRGFSLDTGACLDFAKCHTCQLRRSR